MLALGWNRGQFGKLVQFVFLTQQRGQVQRAGFIGDDLKFGPIENQFVDDKPAKKKIPQTYSKNELARVQQRRRRETRIVGNAKLRGDEAKLAEPMNFQTVEIDVLAEDFLQLLLHLIAISDREDVKSLHEHDRRSQEDDDERGKNFLRAFHRISDGGTGARRWESNELRSDAETD